MRDICKLNYWVFVRLFYVLPMLGLMCMSSCSIMPNELEKDLLLKSELLGGRPFERSKLINVYNLEKSKSRVSNGSIRSSCVIFSEEWEITGGYKIYGYKYKYIDSIALDPDYIDKIAHAQQKEFDRVYIVGDSGKKLYDTGSQSMGSAPKNEH